MKKWIATYEENEIVVTNTILKMCLYINDELQDKFTGLYPPDAPLLGRLKNGEEVKIRPTGFFTMKIIVFVNNKEIECTTF